jgi:hypothetical protein
MEEDLHQKKDETVQRAAGFTPAVRQKQHRENKRRRSLSLS